jgi:threonine/homoserine efflux transporter RhtA
VEALSRAGVTIVLPMTAIEYAFGAILAVMLLKESVPPVRWLGIALVIVGSRSSPAAEVSNRRKILAISGAGLSKAL